MNDDMVRKLLDEVREAKSQILEAEESRARKLDDLKRLSEIRGMPIAQAVDEMDKFQRQMNERLNRVGAAIDKMSKQLRRPGSSDFAEGDGREQAAWLVVQKHSLRTPKADPAEPKHVPSATELDEAELAAQ